MNISYESYRIFYHVAVMGSISKAAEVLLISQPAVTWQIKSLEEQLGITLFVRTKHGVVLTDEGKIFFEYVKKGVESFTNGENALTNFKNLDYGTIRIGASATVAKYVLMPYLRVFHEKYPNIEIKIINNLTENLLSELRNGNLDMLILNLPMKVNKDFKITKVLDVSDIFVGDKKYYDLTKGSVKLKDLGNYPLIFQKKPSNTREYLDNYLKDNNVNILPKMEVVSYNLIMDLVGAGFGIGYATKEFAYSLLENKTLYEIKVTPKIPKRFIGIVTLNKSILNYSVKKLVDLMTMKKK